MYAWAMNQIQEKLKEQQETIQKEYQAMQSEIERLRKLLADAPSAAGNSNVADQIDVVKRKCAEELERARVELEHVTEELRRAKEEPATHSSDGGTKEATSTSSDTSLRRKRPLCDAKLKQEVEQLRAECEKLRRENLQKTRDPKAENELERQRGHNTELARRLKATETELAAVTEKLRRKSEELEHAFTAPDRQTKQTRDEDAGNLRREIDDQGEERRLEGCLEEARQEAEQRKHEIRECKKAEQELLAKVEFLSSALSKLSSLNPDMDDEGQVKNEDLEQLQDPGCCPWC